MTPLETTTEPAAASLHVSTPPHIRQKGEVPAIMLSVIAALSPAFIGALFFFGIKALLLTIVCIAAAAATERLICLAIKKPSTAGDYSAVVTGMLLAFSLPPALPLWMGVLGSVFAVAVVKMAFGGLGNNFMNPALAGRAFLLVSYPAAMTHWSAPLHGTIHGLSHGLDGISSATPLTYFKNALASGNFHPLDFQEALPVLWGGNVGGCVGETSAVLLIVGALYLWYKHIIGLSIPALFIGTVFLLSWLFNGTGYFFTSEALIVPFYQVLAGGLILGALFMATDPVTTPITSAGRIVFGIGCGALTFALRKWSGAAEGAGFAIILMNCCTPLIDKCVKPRRYGEVKKGERHF
jgi:electron transport complex protein RnfD